MYAKLSKCEFWLKEVTFLGHMILAYGILFDQQKVKAVLKWDRPANVTEICNFLILVGYYMRFIEGFSTISIPITRLTRKGTKWEWNREYEERF